MGQDATAFQAEVAAILDCVTSCLRKRPAKEQTTICTDRQVAVAALGASGTKSLLVMDCLKKTDSVVGSKPGALSLKNAVSANALTFNLAWY